MKNKAALMPQKSSAFHTINNKVNMDLSFVFNITQAKL